MAANKKQDRDEREARIRVRGYQARRAVHEHQQSRRRRDNVVAGIAVVVVAVLAVVAQVYFFNGGPGTPAPSSSATATPAATPTATPAAGANTGTVPPSTLAQGRTWTGTLGLNGIDLGITLDGAAAPQAVSSTISLVQADFYSDLTCHRLTTSGIFVLQCGDPKGDGSGGPGYSYGPVENAPADNVYPAGTIAMARQSANGFSQGSQFFILYQDSTIPADAAGGYTVIGHVTSGLDQVKAQITDAGVADGSTDGTPKVTTLISAFSVQ
ncbi:MULTISPECIES: peptidylprolyl isomerase [unclassified Cryobacterium]|uniref:peptidylprolyl isomerase n=1 Tax=unclassified Cryobacterium TaxID=2649013 RepID=UPI002AB33337|nr:MULTISPECIES: peptidylprolyl isomerase [unclassified Cryobacterium]MDY7544067.1 peptidylprolyl isomerase [Cryobacterium sp. 5B3]MEA9997923.1 peptidylprolyl isomerase [Cryobacterium sp. RTS3]MEB0265223.1 peptidylprolyl isomerase [Cryobacterium sp. 10I5]MEB0273254.1 peptidylprolyl isomerase [Cryobacterium sp. 5B3]